MTERGRHWAIGLTQLAIAVVVGCLVLSLDTSMNKIIPAVTGFAAAYALTVWPLKFMDWWRS